MSRKKKTKKGLHPGVAVGLLVVGGGFAAKSMLGTLAPAKPAGPEPTFSTEIAGDSVGPDATDAHGQDLLAVHGSHDLRIPVRMALRAATDASATNAATPLAETAPVPAGEWEGLEPPQLRLGVVMVSGKARRASLGGRIVGVGDRLGDATVRTIERGHVQVQWRGRHLTYAIGGDVPLEFRAEQARRDAAKQAARAAEAADDTAAAGEPAAGKPAVLEPTRTPGASQDQKPQKQE